jgi:hypothetical protein
LRTRTHLPDLMPNRLAVRRKAVPHQAARPRGVLAALAAALLAGCASAPGPGEIARLDQSALCCASARELPIAGALQDTLPVSLSTASPVFLFPTGPAYAYGFELPERPRTYRLELRALPGGWAPFKDSTGQALAQRYVPAAVLFLDINRKIILDDTPRDTRAECTRPYRCQFELVGTLPVPDGARYAVVHARYERIGQQYVDTYRPATETDGLLLDNTHYTGQTTSVLGLFTATGELVVRVRRPAAAANPDAGPAPAPGR